MIHYSLLISIVVVRFKSIGAAPIMKNNVFKVTAGNKYATVVTFLRGQLGSKEGDPLVCSSPLFTLFPSLLSIPWSPARWGYS
jgi:hypothetical protein